MKLISTLTLLLLGCLSQGVTAQIDTIFSEGEKAKNVHHSGDVWLSHLSEADSVFNYSITVARFAPNAKLDWHFHPAGQQLLILDGKGYYQERGKPVQIVNKGDVIKCTQGLQHWHAAATHSGVTYLAITGNKKTEWFEPVSEEFYSNVESIQELGLDNTATERTIMSLSKQKWDWMADKNVEPLADLFDEKSVFVHMGGSWGKEQELKVIQSGEIHYKKADIHEVSVNIIDNTAILLNRITLLAVVGGNEVSNSFMVTEVYAKKDDGWKIGSLSFTKLVY